MEARRPTVAPPGRLVRLGVVLDTRNPVGRLVEIARMCDRAGIGALWVEDPPAAEAGLAGGGVPPAPRLEAWTALALVAGEVRRARLGVLLDAAARPPALLARMVATAAAALGGRLEVTLRSGAGAATAARAAEALRRELADLAVPAAVAPGSSGPILGTVALPPERPTIAVEVAGAAGPGGAAGPIAADLDLDLVDDVLLPAGPVATTLQAAAAFRRAERGEGQLGIAARLPVSVGRTLAEARARWDAEPAFAALGPPDEVAIFGTLEQCHDRVVALAHAGVTDLRCLLPNAIDVHDVIAQLTAMTVGSADKLVPGAPRTRVPEPPPGWGGRPRFPRPPADR